MKHILSIYYTWFPHKLFLPLLILYMVILMMGRLSSKVICRFIVEQTMTMVVAIFHVLSFIFFSYEILEKIIIFHIYCDEQYIDI